MTTIGQHTEHQETPAGVAVQYEAIVTAARGMARAVGILPEGTEVTPPQGGTRFEWQIPEGVHAEVARNDGLVDAAEPRHPDSDNPGPYKFDPMFPLEVSHLGICLSAAGPRVSFFGQEASFEIPLDELADFKVAFVSDQAE